MEKKHVSPYFAYALIVTLVASLFSMPISFQPIFASHSDIELVELSDFEPQPGDEITISGFINNAEEDADVDITIREPDGGSAGDADTQVDEDEEFSETFEIPDPTPDGIYEVEVEFEGEEPTYAYFLIDEDDDDVSVVTDVDTYEPGQDVEISGEVENPQTGETEVDIVVLDPEGDDIGPGSVDVDNSDEFEDSIELDDEAHPGLYAIIVEYDGEEAGWFIFQVEEDGGSSGTGDITASLVDSTLAPGDEVEITGSIDDNDIEGGAEVILVVEDPDGDVIDEFDDSVEPDSDTGEFDFSFDLDEDADTGTYTVILSYEELDDKELTFSVSTSSGGGSGGGGSSSGLTARLSKSSLLAGESLTVSGVVPRIVTDEDGVSITLFEPDRGFIAAKYPEPDSSEAYTATFILPSTLEVDEDYIVVVFYDDNEVELSFDITGKASGSVGALTVQTDKASYGVGSTVRITGEIADEIFVEGRQVALQVYNPDGAAYRFDPITPEDDGSYSYSMPVGGPLGVTGEWDVKVTYGTQAAETTFDLTGGVPSTPRYELTVEGDTFTIEYESDGTINSMYVRPLEKKLVVSIDGEQEGQLTLTLPRVVIDAVESGSDIKYIVSTLDTETGEEKVVEITEGASDANERTIIIDYDAGTDLIEIQGTNIVPEFGPLSAIVLAIAVFSIIAVTARFSNRFSAFRQW